MSGTTASSLVAALKPYEYNIFTLSNGMRCVHRRSNSRVAYTGVAIDAGSRDEPDERQGLAHFVEHTIFKGTGKRKSWHISDRMESIGGELNAYTSKETTVVYTIAPATEPERAIELLADLIANASFPESEIEKEKEVVIEEIKGALDNPADDLFDEFEQLAYSGNRLGHDILGTPESVRSLTSADCRDFVNRLYTPGHMVLFVQSPDPAARIERLAEKHFGKLKRVDTPRHRIAPCSIPDFNELRDRQGHQAHTLVGAATFNRHDPRRYALLLYNSLLAGPSMNSRLNQELRERRGLVYTVDSSVSMLSDTGMEYIYFGADKSAIGKCLKIIDRELSRLADKELSPSTFDKIKKQYCGQLLVNSDNLEATAMSMGKSVLFFNEVHDAAYSAARVCDVTPADLLEVARMVAENSSHRLTLC